MKVNHNDFRLFEYENNPSKRDRFILGEVVQKKDEDRFEIGVIIQCHGNDEYRTDMFGNCYYDGKLGDIKKATAHNIFLYRPSLLSKKIGL